MLSSRQFITVEHPIDQPTWDSNVNEQEPETVVVVHQLIPDPFHKWSFWWHGHGRSRRVWLGSYSGRLGFFECLDCAFYLGGVFLKQPLGWHRQWPAQHQGQHIVRGHSSSWRPSALQKWCAPMPRWHQMSVWVPGAVNASYNTPPWPQHGQLPKVETVGNGPPVHSGVTQRCRTGSPIYFSNDSRTPCNAAGPFFYDDGGSLGLIAGCFVLCFCS